MGRFSKKKRSAGKTLSIDTVIGSEASFEGVLQTKNSICIEGGFKGKLKCEGQVILSKSANIQADIVAEYVAINGKVTGNITALKRLDVGATGVVRGHVKAASVTVEKGGILDGTCKMLSNYKANERPAPIAALENLLPNGKATVAKSGQASQNRKNEFIRKGGHAPKTQSEAIAPMAET